MKTEYKRDMQHNYFVIHDVGSDVQTFQEKMIIHNHLEGCIPFFAQSINEERMFCYEVSGLQSLAALTQRVSLTYNQLTQVVKSLVNIIKQAAEYLLRDADFVFEPEYMFLKLPSYDLSVCYYPGYNKPIKDQLSHLFDYLMGCTDYEDKEAVYAVYSLYMKSKEAGCTINDLSEVLSGKRVSIDIAQAGKPINQVPSESYVVTPSTIRYDPDTGQKIVNTDSIAQTVPSSQLQTVPSQIDVQQTSAILQSNTLQTSTLQTKPLQATPLQYSPVQTCTFQNNPKQEKSSVNSSVNRVAYDTQTVSRTTPTYNDSAKVQGEHRSASSKRLPFVTERREDEREVLYYPVQIYVLAGAIAFIVILVIVGAFTSGLLKDSMTERIAPVKLFGLLLIVISLAGYGFFRLFRSENKQSKMVSEVHYQQPTYHELAVTTERESLNNGPVNYEAADYKSIQDEMNTYDYSKQHGRANELQMMQQSEEEETILLNPPHKILHTQLVSEQPEKYETIIIEEYPFYIGTVKNRMNYSIKSTVISRYHAKIEKEEKMYYVTDLHSTNGTYLNGSKLTPDTQYALVTGDKISFADVMFTFETP